MLYSNFPLNCYNPLPCLRKAIFDDPSIQSFWGVDFLYKNFPTIIFALMLIAVATVNNPLPSLRIVFLEEDPPLQLFWIADFLYKVVPAIILVLVVITVAGVHFLLAWASNLSLEHLITPGSFVYEASEDLDKFATQFEPYPPISEYCFAGSHGTL